MIIKNEHKKNINNKFLWCILNSKITNWYVYNFVFASAIRTMHFYNPVTSKIPVPNADKNIQNILSEKAILLINLHKKLQKKATKYIKRIKSNLEIRKISEKLQKFYNFDFKIFITELSKQKVRISLKQQDEWEDYFDSYKKEINDLQYQINEIDKKIDKIVYKLYDLSKEEIKIIENYEKI